MKNKFMQVNGYAIILFTILFSGCGAQSKLTKYLRKDLNDSAARYWADFIEKNGINAIDDDGDTLLYYAIEKYQDPVLIDLCLKAKADFHLVPRGKQDLVVVAFRLGNEAIWDVLFKNGFPVRNKGEGIKYDLLYNSLKETGVSVKYAKFFLNYYTKKDLDYRGYVSLYNLTWGKPERNELFFEMDRKGYKPHIQNVRDFIYDYVVYEDEPSLKEEQFECIKKYISDEYYKKEKSYIIDLNRFSMLEEKNRLERLFKVLDFIFERGYEFEDAYFADWVRKCFEYTYRDENTKLNHALRVVDYCKNHNADLNVTIEKEKQYTGDIIKQHVLDHSIDKMYDYWQRNETLKKRNETPYESWTQEFDWYTGIVNILLEKGINSVSKTNSDGQEYSIILQKLGLSDKINIADE